MTTTLLPPTARPLTAGEACVVVPSYNEAPVVQQVVADLRRRFDLVVCVDDGSSDRTADRAAAAGATVVRHPVNLGQGAALQTGFDYALRATSAAYVVTFDGDGQHDPDDAVRMVHLARDRAVDAVLGSRFLAPAATGPSLPGRRRLLLRGAAWFTRVATGLELTDSHNGLRVLSREAVTRLHLDLPGMAHASELLHQIARERLRFLEAPVTVAYTDYSRSKGQPGINAVNIVVDLLLHRVCAVR